MMLPYSAIKRDKMLAKGQPYSLYGTLGDAYLQKRIVTALLDWVLPADARDFNMDVLDGETTPVSEVLARAGNLPFLSDHRVIHVQRAERIEGMQRSGDDGETKTKGKASPSKRLIEGLEKLPPTSIVILSRTPETPEPGARAGTARCVHATVDKTIDKMGVIVDCTVSGKNTALATTILEEEARERGIPLSREAAAHLVERAGHDIANLCNELDKCALRVGVGEMVTPIIIDEMVKRQPQETIFDLTDALGERRGPRAIGLLRELMSGGEPPELILTMLVRHLRQLLQARTLIDARLPLDGSVGKRISPALAAQFPRESRDNLVNLLQTQNWLGRRLAQQARNFSVEQLQKALEASLATDLAMKGIEDDGGTPDLLIEMW